MKVFRKFITAHSGGVLASVSVEKAEEMPVGGAGVLVTLPRTFDCGAYKRVILRADLQCYPQAAVDQQACLKRNMEQIICVCVRARACVASFSQTRSCNWQESSTCFSVHTPACACRL